MLRYTSVAAMRVTCPPDHMKMPVGPFVTPAVNTTEPPGVNWILVKLLNVPPAGLAAPVCRRTWMSDPARIRDCRFDTVPTKAACRLAFNAMLVRPPVPIVRLPTGWLNGNHSVNTLSKYR